MVKYEYVNIKSDKIIGSLFTEHRAFIDDYAKRGYKYIGFIPTNINDYGKFKGIDLIFEIDEK